MTVRTYLSVGFLDRIITPRKRYKRYKKKDFDEGVGEAWHPDGGNRYTDDIYRKIIYLHVWKLDPEIYWYR